MPDWSSLPRLLHELCYCGQVRPEVYRFDLPNGHHMWLCKGCYMEELNPPTRIDLKAVAAARLNIRKDPTDAPQ